MGIKNKTIEYQTRGEFDFIDITGDVKSFVEESNIKNGLVNIQSLHTTMAVILNEKEPLLIEDMKKNLENTGSKGLTYNHDDFKRRTVNLCDGECVNGHSHCRAIHLPSNIVLNLIGGKIQFGQWQSVMIIELDRPKKRKVQIQIIGE